METSRNRLLLRDLAYYLPVSLVLGACMNALGHLLCLAWFQHWWQVATCYWGYVVPVALALRRCSGWDQFAWGIVAMVPLELVGYGLGTSVACPGNVIEEYLGPRNFSLAMVLICGPLPWLLNTLVAAIRRTKAAGAPA